MFLQLGKELRMVSGKPSDIKMRLDAGVYNIRVVADGRTNYLHFEKTERYKETTILDAGVFKKVERHVDNFLTPEMYAARKSMRSLNKMGMLFAGDPGTGKTFLAGQIGQKLADEIDAITIMTNTFTDFNLPQLVDAIRDSEPERMIVVILDEFEKCKEYQLQDGDLLGYLDGNTSRDNVLNIALVNATSNMKSFLLKRPGRFEQVYDFDEKDDKVLEALVRSMTPKEFVDRIDSLYITQQLIIEGRRTVDCITIAIRDAIAEIIYFDNHGAFKSFNSFTSGITTAKKIGFKNEALQGQKTVAKKDIKVLEEEIEELEYELDSTIG